MISIQEPHPVSIDQLIEFSLDVYNPPLTPDVGDNFWRCVLYDPSGNIVSSDSFEGWSIIPQLNGVQVKLIGPLYEATMYSTISVSFTAVSAADDVSFQFLVPSGFDFSAASITDPTQVIFQAVGSLIRIRTPIVAGNTYLFTLNNVLLGTGGGQTQINLATWSGGYFQSGVWIPGNRQDEKYNFQDGFRLPGQVIVLYDKLSDIYQNQPLTYPIQSLWSHQMGKPAFVEFHFSLTQIAQSGTYLRISASPYRPTVSLFTLQVGLSTEASSGITSGGLAPTLQNVAAQVTSVVGGQLMVLLNQQLLPFQIYQIMFSVIAPNPVDVHNHVGPITWTIQTIDSAALPVNTNDGLGRAFSIVEAYGFSVSCARAPPNAQIVVSLDIVPALAVITEIHIVLPLYWNITQNCLVNGMDVIKSCTRGLAMPDGQASATLLTYDAGITSELNGVQISVITPPQNPLDISWFVEGLNQLTQTQLGWGQATGITTTQMSGTSVIIPGIPSVQTLMIWQFTSQTAIAAGGFLQLLLPAGYNPQCSGIYLQSIALPLSGGCNTANPTSIIIFLNATMVPGPYAFGIYVTPPPSTPILNTLSIMVLDKHGMVQDAAMHLPGPPIRDKLKIKAAPLLWTQSNPNMPSVATVGFEVIDDLPDNVVAPDQQVAQILIVLPSGFQQTVQKTTDFVILNSDMPLASGNWLNYLLEDRLIVTMNLNQTAWKTLKAGVFMFSFPIQIPATLPVYNVWTLSLCTPSTVGCIQTSDPTVLVNFGILGFTFGGKSANSPGLTASARPHQGLSWTISILLIAALQQYLR